MAIQPGYSTINPFIVADDLNGLLQFVTEVFDGVERPWVRTMGDDGLLVHAEVQIGDASILFGERRPDWPYTPALIQVYVPDVRAALDRAVARGGVVVTEPTPFFGETFSRMRDPWGNGWWVYQPADEDDADADGSGADDGSAWTEEDGEDWERTPELEYIHDTMATMFTSLEDPRSAGGSSTARSE